MSLEAQVVEGKRYSMCAACDLVGQLALSGCNLHGTGRKVEGDGSGDVPKEK